MRAWQIVSNGGIDALKLADLDTPEPGHGEVRVRTHASSINYRDLMTVKDPEPRGNPGRWATPNDYPSRALREEREGVASFTVTVDTDGRVTSCRITRSSGHDDLDEATCKNIERRARFRPATDGNGQETTGTWSSSVRWQIPD